MARYRKKPIVIEAMQFKPKHKDEVLAFAKGCTYHDVDGVGKYLSIPTLEGTMYAQPNDWIIRGVAGEFFPCKPDIFAATYEPVD